MSEVRYDLVPKRSKRYNLKWARAVASKFIRLATKASTASITITRMRTIWAFEPVDIKVFYAGRETCIISHTLHAAKAHFLVAAAALHQLNHHRSPVTKLRSQTLNCGLNSSAM